MRSTIRLAVLVTASVLVSGVLLASSPASATTPPAMSTVNMSCVSGSHCVAVGAAGGKGAIAVTFDSGESWARQPVPNGSTVLSGVSCFGDLSCTAVGSPVTGAPFIVSTSNGGATWNRQVIMAPPPGITVGDLLSVSCPSTSDTSCQAVGNTTMGGGVIMRKSSSTSLWTVTALTSGQLSSVSCAGTVNCYASGTVADGSDFAAVVMATHNSGQSWSQAFHYPASAAASATSSRFNSIACVQSQCETVGVTEGMGTVPLAFGTIDNGKTWTALKIPSGFAPAAVRCVSMTSCFMVSGSKVEFTSNNGASFASQIIPTGITDLNNIKCGSALSCMAFGPSHLITTFNQGQTWFNRILP